MLTLPTPKLERWKFTNLGLKIKQVKAAFVAPDIQISGNKTYLSDDKNANWIKDILSSAPHGQAQYGDMMLVDAAREAPDHSVIVEVPKNTQSADPLVISHASVSDGYTASRLFVRVDEGADFTLIEYHSGVAAAWNNAVAHIKVGRNARLRHYRIQEYGPSVVYTQNTHAQIERDGNYEVFTLTTGAGMSRNQIQGELLGENGRCSLSGLNLLSGRQHGDATLLIEHKAPHCSSNQLYKNILKDEARGVFQGKIFVDQIAQKTDGYQLSNNLLLSSLTEMDVKPELEIYADDVKCSHGSTTGALDETPMFYLRSRGLNESEARKLLLEAFIGQAMESITHETAQKEISERAQAWLSQI